ncbi:MAG: hypothetical protein WC450_08630 [Candidatus Omnitrophota bacterium]|jgi:hypothetical protein
MVQLTEEEAAEIYYALDSKHLQLHQGVFGNDPTAKKWARDIFKLMEKIGTDGENLVEVPEESDLGSGIESLLIGNGARQD